MSVLIEGHAVGRDLNIPKDEGFGSAGFEGVFVTRGRVQSRTSTCCSSASVIATDSLALPVWSPGGFRLTQAEAVSLAVKCYGHCQEAFDSPSILDGSAMTLADSG